MTAFHNDTLYALRLWRRNPIVTIGVLLSLTLGMGATVATFSVVNSLLLKPLAVPSPELMVRLTDSSSRPAQLSTALWADLSERQSSLQGLAAYAAQFVDTSRPSEAAVETPALFVSENFFETLGIAPQVGTLIGDPTVQSEGVAVLGHKYWLQEFGGDASVVGRSILVERKPMTVIGVTPRGFEGVNFGQTFDIALPIDSHSLLYPSSGIATDPESYWLQVVGRLRELGGEANSAAELRTIGSSFPAPDAQARVGPVAIQGWTLRSANARSESQLDAFRTIVALPALIAALVLIVACVNAMHLLMARLIDRRTEFATRLALGASPLQLLRQIATEAFLLAFVASVLSVLFAWVGLRMITRQIAELDEFPHLAGSVDPTVLWFAVALATVVALVSGFWPAVRAMQAEPISALRQAQGTGRRRTLISYALLAGQVAVVFVLLHISLTLVHHVLKLTRQDYGFDHRLVSLVSVSIAQADERPVQRVELTSLVLRELQQLPGVQRAALSMSAPFGTVNYLTTLEGTEVRVHYTYVTSDYFDVMGMRMLAGSGFHGPTSGRAAVVSQGLADRYLSGHVSVARKVALAGIGTFDIVGIVGNTRFATLSNTADEFVYLQWPAALLGSRTLWHFSLRRDAGALLGEREVANAVENIVPGASVTVRGLDMLAMDTISTEKAVSLIATTYGALAMALTVVGLFAIVAYHVRRRRVEIAVRIAVGATSRQVVQLMLVDVAVACAGGLLAGAVMLAIPGPLLSTSTGVGADAPAWAAPVSSLLIAIVVFAAALVPARRAAAVEPAVVLGHIGQRSIE